MRRVRIFRLGQHHPGGGCGSGTDVPEILVVDDRCWS